MRVKLINTNPVDVVVDILGNNDVKDKVILHPKTSKIFEITDSALQSVKSQPGIQIQVVGSL